MQSFPQKKLQNKTTLPTANCKKPHKNPDKTPGMMPLLNATMITGSILNDILKAHVEGINKSKINEITANIATSINIRKRFDFIVIPFFILL